MSKHYIKEQLKTTKGEYSILDFDNLATKIFKTMKDSDYTENKVKKTMARYSVVKNGKVTFNTNFNSDLDYYQLKEKLIKEAPKKVTTKSSKFFDNLKVDSKDSTYEEQKSKTSTKISNNKPKSSNFLMNLNFGKDDDENTTNKVTTNKHEDESDTDRESELCYIYTLDTSFKPQKKCPPFGTDWIYDKNQVDDKIGKDEKRRTNIFNKLAKLKFPAQKSQAWLDLRQKVISASDGGCTLGDNDYEPSHKLLYKKVMAPPFEPNENCYHGNKYEQIATMTYEYRMNVNVREFGLVQHPDCHFLGASPDGIISPYKADGQHLTRYVGRMLEIKCPTTREIKTTGEVKANICPIYYWDQVQLQLECTDLDECDFWQCKISEYNSRTEFIEDTDSKEPFRSKHTGYEKGCIIQVLPINKRLDAQNLKLQMKKYIEEDESLTNEEKNKPENFEEVDNGDDEEIQRERYLNIVYESSKHIYPPRIDMTPYEIDEWIIEVTNNFHKQKLLDDALNIRDYYIDKIIFWRIEMTHCALIKRDKEWFDEIKPKMEKMWNYVLYLRQNLDKAKILFDYADSVTEKVTDFKNPKKLKDKKMSASTKEKIMKVIENICNEPSKKDKMKQKEYNLILEEIKENTKKNIKVKDNKGYKFY